MNQEKTVTINLKDRIVKLQLHEFETDVDMDDILKIDYSNILGEVLTFPVLLNRIGILRAEMEEIVSAKKFEVEIFNAELSEIYRENLTGKGNRKKPTQAQVDNAVLKDERFIKKRKSYYRVKRDYEYIDSLYWAAKDKSKKLDWCSNGIKPADFEKEILEGSINGIMIKSHEKLIKDRE